MQTGAARVATLILRLRRLRLRRQDQRLRRCPCRAPARLTLVVRPRSIRTAVLFLRATADSFRGSPGKQTVGHFHIFGVGRKEGCVEETAVTDWF